MSILFSESIGAKSFKLYNQKYIPVFFNPPLGRPICQIFYTNNLLVTRHSSLMLNEDSRKNSSLKLKLWHVYQWN